MSLLTELKRRNVFKIGAAYVVVGWVIIEVSSTLAPQLNLPEWAPRLATFLILLGFPVALVLAWIFDMTPEGVQVTQGSTGNKPFYGIVALVAAVSIGGFFLYGGGMNATDEPATTEAEANGRSSIAVLPFVNMSTDAENEFFADGISEELLNILAGVEGLDVASRTSAFSFKGKDTPIPEIARLLGVRHVLEGSVRRQGTRVRITAQLIDAERDVHLWSETYDRDLTDIFVVQEEIAQAITDALHDILGTREVQVQASTGNIEAYERFLAARARFYQRNEMDEVLAEFRAVVEMDPQLTDAWAFMAASAFVIVTSSPDTTEYPLEQLVGWVDEGVETVLARNPEHSLALAVMGANLFRMGEIREGEEALARAVTHERGDSTAHLWLGIHRVMMGRPSAALPLFEEAYRRDPLVSINIGYLATTYMMLGRRAEALLMGRQVLATGNANAASLLAIEYAASGEYELSVEFFAAGQRGSNLSITEQAATVAAYAAALENPELREAFLREYGTPAALPYYQLLFRDSAFLEYLETDANYVQTIPVWLPSTLWVRESRELYRFMESIGVADYWEQAGFPDGCTVADGPDGRHLACSGGD